MHIELAFQFRLTIYYIKGNIKFPMFSGIMKKGKGEILICAKNIP